MQTVLSVVILRGVLILSAWLRVYRHDVSYLPWQVELAMRCFNFLYSLIDAVWHSGRLTLLHVHHSAK